MQPDERLFTILEKLLEKSRSNQVLWQETDVADEFVVSFEGARLSLKYQRPSTELDFILVRLVAAERKELWRLVIEEGAKGWPVALQLFQEAKRSAFKVDGLLEVIEREISGSNKVGTSPSPQRVEDIPF
jgi:hypothetical protein